MIQTLSDPSTISEAVPAAPTLLLLADSDVHTLPIASSASIHTYDYDKSYKVIHLLIRPTGRYNLPLHNIMPTG